MSSKCLSAVTLSTLAMVLVPHLAAGQSAPAGSVTIHNPWIANDRVADCRNLQAMGATFKNAYSPDGVMPPADDQTIAINCYNNHKRRFYHWANIPPNGPNGITLDDPVYGINNFGWGLCFNHGPQNATIAVAAGLPDAHRIDLNNAITGKQEHVVYEVFYWGRWHLFDTMTTMYVYDRGTPRQVASAADVAADTTLMTQAVSQGRACPGYLLCGDDANWFSNACKTYTITGGPITNNWTMDMDLHTGETFKRTWENWANEFPPKSAGQNDPPFHHEAQNDNKDSVNFPYWEPYYAQVMDSNGSMRTTYRRWANGTYDVKPDFRTNSYKAMLYSGTGIATYRDDGIAPDLHPAAVGAQAEAIFHIKLPLYITDAAISGTFVRTNPGDIARIDVSSDGVTWTTIWTDSAIGTTSLTNRYFHTQVYGMWEYYVKIVLLASSGSIGSAGVSNLDINTSFEHNKGAMAYLDKGVNNMSFTFDNPQDLLAGNSRIKLTYKWKEYGTSSWTVDKSFTTYVYSSPANFQITTGGAKVPRTEYIQMDVLPWLYGDIDASGSVNLADLKLLVAAWNSSSGSSNWNANADIDVDNAVSLSDLKILVLNWGKSL